LASSNALVVTWNFFANELKLSPGAIAYSVGAGASGGGTGATLVVVAGAWFVTAGGIFVGSKAATMLVGGALVWSVAVVPA